MAEAAEEPKPAGSPFPFRLLFRMASAIYLITLPSCTRDVGHFGPGFFPFLAALVLVPLLGLATVSDAAVAWSEAAEAKGAGTKWAAALFMTLLAGGYLGIILYVVLEKSR